MRSKFSYLIIFAVFFSSCGILIKRDQFPADFISQKSVDKIRLVWNDDPATTITIAWDQQFGENPVVYYGNSDFKQDWQKYPNQQAPTRNTYGYRGMNNQFAEIKNLQPDTRYYFVIKDSREVSKRFWFKTAPDRPQPFTFLGWGDTKSDGETLTAGRFSNQMVAKLRPLFVIYNGDFTSGDGTNDLRWHRWFRDWQNLTTTRDGRMFPLVPVHGNHENGDKTVLNKLFNAPYQFNNEENIYYDLSLGGDFFYFLALNSEIEEGGDQRDWLEEKLRNHQHFTFKTAGYHKPFRPHTSGKGENDHQYEQWAGLFYQYGLDLSTDGDSHMSKITFPLKPSNEPGSFQGFIRDDEKGTMFIGEGSWGAMYRKNDDDKPWTMRSGSFNQIKWVQVFPETNGVEAHMAIRTVITSERDAEERAISFVRNVENLTEEDVFKLPEYIRLFSTPETGDVIYYPLRFAPQKISVLNQEQLILN